jgi:hypothetical protein
LYYLKLLQDYNLRKSATAISHIVKDKNFMFQAQLLILIVKLKTGPEGLEQTPICDMVDNPVELHGFDMSVCIKQ